MWHATGAAVGRRLHGESARSVMRRHTFWCVGWRGDDYEWRGDNYTIGFAEARPLLVLATCYVHMWCFACTRKEFCRRWMVSASGRVACVPHVVRGPCTCPVSRAGMAWRCVLAAPDYAI